MPPARALAGKGTGTALLSRLASAGAAGACALAFGVAGCASRTASFEEGGKGMAVAWDRATLRRVSSATEREGYNGYGRMVQLEDGTLRCVYEANGRIVVVASHDEGVAWSEPILVADSEPGLCMAVPDALVLADGSILVSYNPRPCPPRDGLRFAIRTKRSVDDGATWRDERTVYEAGEKFGDGCWEPAAIELPGGEVRLFFANEGPYTESEEQNISMVRSADGGLAWSPVPEIVAFRTDRRDGMPSPALLDTGRIAVAIEDNGVGAFKPFVIQSEPGGAFPGVVRGDSADRWPAHTVALSPEIYAGAPCLRQLSSGETILSYQGTEGRRNEGHQYADMKVVVGDRDARNFGGKTVPFEIPPGGSALWNSLAILADDTIVAVTSTSAYTPGEVEVWMIKGRLARISNQPHDATVNHPTIPATSFARRR